MSEDERSDVAAQKTHLIEMPDWSTAQPSGEDGAVTGKRLVVRGVQESSKKPEPVESQATMALDMLSVEEMRKLEGRRDEPAKGGEEATQLLDVSELRNAEALQEATPRRAKVQLRQASPSTELPLLDAHRAVAFGFDRLPRVAAEECRALNELYALLPDTRELTEVAEAVAARLGEVVGCEHSVRWCGASMAIASGGSVELDDGSWTWGRMPPGHSRFLVGATGALADVWVSAIAPEKPGVLGHDFQFGMVTYVLAQFCEAFGSQVGWPAASWAVNPMGVRDLKAMLLSGESMLLELTFNVECGGRRGLVRWWLPSRLLSRLKGQTARERRWNEEASTAWWGGLVVKRPVLVGTTMVREWELERIRVGDVLLVERHGVEMGEVTQSSVEGGAQWRFGAGVALRGRMRMEQTGWWGFEVDAAQLIARKEEAEVSEEKQPQSPDAGVSVEKTQMEVEVRLGTIEMELADLARLRPGQVLECSTPLGSAVDLVVSGRSVGNGELVGVDGRLGVRILSTRAAENR